MHGIPLPKSTCWKPAFFGELLHHLDGHVGSAGPMLAVAVRAGS